MSESMDQVARVDGYDVIIWMGCSGEWGSLVVETAQEVKPGDVTQVDILLREDTHGTISAARKTIDAQLQGDDPERLLPDAPYHYRLGFSSPRATKIRNDLVTTLEFGADAHKLELMLSHQTLREIVTQLSNQVRQEKQ